MQFALKRRPKAESNHQLARHHPCLPDSQLAINEEKAVPTNLTSSHCRDENHPRFSRAESGKQLTEHSNFFIRNIKTYLQNLSARHHALCAMPSLI